MNTGAANTSGGARDGESTEVPKIPDHTLLRCIGRGSYGEVWLARTVLGEHRAVKIVYRSRFEHDRPYEREFEGIRKFEPISRSHESQVAILHVGRNDEIGYFYYVMELADDAAGESEQVGKGERESGPISPAPSLTFSPATYQPHTLKLDLQRRARLPVDECVRIGLALTTALENLHGHELVHRDIKPSNIIFVKGVPKLADIGLVASMDATMSFVGTSGFLPPEGPGTPQGDIYSLGKVLYEISMGRDRTEFPKLPADLADSPDGKRLLELNAVIVKACHHDPRRRYQSAQKMAADLALLQAGKSVRRTRGHQLVWSRIKKAALGLVLLALVVAGVARLARQGQRTDATGDGPPSTNELANALCTKALMNLRGDNQRGYPEVYTNLHRAIQLDPNFSKPYLGLLELVLRENMPGVKFPPSENEQTITERLVELAPNSAAAHCGQAILAFYGFDYAGVERHARRAVEVGPDYELGHSFYGYMLMIWGRTSEARRELETARKLNPSKVQIYRILAHSYYADRDFRRAIAMYRETVAWEPHDLVSYYYLGFAHRALGDFHAAIDAFEMGERIRTGDTNRAESRFDRLRQAFVRGGAPGYWEEAWTQTSTDQFFYRAGIQVRRGFTNDAFQLLERAYETRTLGDGLQDHDRVQNHLSSLLLDEVWDPLHADPRFQQLLGKLGFTKVNPEWRK